MIVTKNKQISSNNAKFIIILVERCLVLKMIPDDQSIFVYKRLSRGAGSVDGELLWCAGEVLCYCGGGVR